MICLTNEHKIAAVETVKLLLSKNSSIDFSNLMKLFYNSFYEDLIKKNDKGKVEDFSVELVKYIAGEMHSKLSDFENASNFITALNKLSGTNNFSYNLDDILSFTRDENVRELIGLNRKKEKIRPKQIDIDNNLQSIILKIQESFPQNIPSTFNFSTKKEAIIVPGTVAMKQKGIEVTKDNIVTVEPLFRPSSISSNKLPQNPIPNIDYNEAIEYGNLVDAAVRYFILNI